MAGTKTDPNTGQAVPIASYNFNNVTFNGNVIVNSAQFSMFITSGASLGMLAQNFLTCTHIKECFNYFARSGGTQTDIYNTNFKVEFDQGRTFPSRAT